ncbi:YbjN domain-containing protein [Demetria terragena]|uniref:YbjN domain-containing protein n=1 Tax=Demetria terragena TaxID=63959 RepID=UPI000362E1D5|nr:YbjN domain-containing protein [Demetria terragena]
MPLDEAVRVLEATLEDAELDWEAGAKKREYVVTLPGDKKLRTVASLLLRERGMSVSAFVIRAPDENHDQFYRHLLRRNLRLPGMAYAIDHLGDVYVMGEVPAEAVTEHYLDQLFGVLLEACDQPFNDLLLLGFRTSMQKEWDWRVDRGESLRNLEAFRSVLQRSDGEKAPPAE